MPTATATETDHRSLAERVADLGSETWTEYLRGLSSEERRRLPYTWRFWARPNQLSPPGHWRVWLILAGRGFGKTRMGAEWVRSQVESGRFGRIALIAETAADARDVMVEGESGLLAISPPWFRPKYEPSKRRLTWPNGTIATTYSGDEPDQLRGPQHSAAWADEPAKWKYAHPAWNNMEFGLRLGPKPQVVATTTPRPIDLIKSLIRDSGVVVTRGHTEDNLANLAPSFIARVVGKYQGTRLGRQELHGELLEDVPGALWKRDQIDRDRIWEAPTRLFKRVVVAIDPAATSGEESDETGIVVCAAGTDGHAYVLADLSGRFSPNGWAERAIKAYEDYQADRIIGEVNNGGEMVGNTIRLVAAAMHARRACSSSVIPYRAIHASRGKQTRAEPVAALAEQGKIHHVGSFPELEDQLCSWSPDDRNSPDRLDAYVYSLTDLMLGPLTPRPSASSPPPSILTGFKVR